MLQKVIETTADQAVQTIKPVQSQDTVVPSETVKENNNEAKTEIPTLAKVALPILKEEYIHIKRVKTTPNLPVIGDAESVARDYKLALGSSYTKSGVLLGRTIFSSPEEEVAIMSQIIGINANSHDFAKGLNDYWINFYVPIPFEGKKLNISKMGDTPVNIHDYVIYLYALKSSQVASSIDDVYNSNRIKFYLWKESEEKKIALVRKEQKDKAIVLRMTIEKDIEKMKSIIILFGRAVPKSLEDQQLVLDELANSQTLKFLQYAEDPLALDKAFIERLIRANLLIRPINSTIVVYDNNMVGKNLEEAVAWSKLPINSETLLALRQRLESFEAQMAI